MSAATVAAICTLVSLLGTIGLAASDPKRLRRKAATIPRPARTGFVLLTLAPGIWLAATMQGVGFLLWIGASAVLGWAVAALASQSTARRKDPA
jgi:hypothetical protein